MRTPKPQHRFAVIAALISTMGCAFATSAQAAKTDSHNPCDLVSWQDLQSFGVNKDTPMAEAGWHQEETPKEIPDGKLFTNMCAIVTKSDAGRSSITLSFDSFRGKASEQQITDWLKSTTPVPEEGEEKPSMVTLGDTTCETGKYNLPTSQADDSVADVAEHYIACDKLAGTHHVSLNIHVPEGKKANLLTPEQAKALLEKSVARIKEKAFSLPAAKDMKAEKTAKST